MRLVGRNISFVKFLKSPLVIIVLSLLTVYMLYLNYRNFSFLAKLYDRLEISKSEYVSTKRTVALAEVNQIDSSTNEATARYRKEFFSALDEGEYVIFIHREGGVAKKEEEARKLSTFEKYQQKIILWWKNR
jgi:hypothetical protein